MDADLVKEQGTLQAQEKMAELSNGCICCTLREDLFTALAQLASRREHLDYVLIESSGISEPLPVAETFTFTDGDGASLELIARLDTMVTVVDGATFLDELYAADKLRSRGWEADAEDERTVAQLFCDQLEFANVIVMNKMDLMDGDGKARLREVLRKFNPDADLIEATHSKVDLKRVLGTKLFDMEKAAAPSGSKKHASVTRAETIEYGISSFTYRSRRPFHPEKLRALAAVMARASISRPSRMPRPKPRARPRPAPRRHNALFALRALCGSLARRATCIAARCRWPAAFSVRPGAAVVG